MAEDQVVFHWKMSGTSAPTVSTAITAIGGTITPKTTDNSKSFDVENVTYNVKLKFMRVIR